MLIDAADRKDPITLSGDTLEGDPLDVVDLRGKVVVVNIWWSACGPCRLEAPMLNGAAAATTDDASFVGVNIRDGGPDVARDFERSHEVVYPSIYDPTGKALLAFAGKINLQSVPQTLVLDREGRIAAVFSGPLPSQLTLTEVVQDVAAEK